MFPIDLSSDRPEVPYSERIFAASKDVFDSYERDEEWTRRVPLHEAYVLFFLETVNDAIGDLVDRWKTNGMVGEFPDALAVQDELKRIICLEDKQCGFGVSMALNYPPGRLVRLVRLVAGEGKAPEIVATTGPRSWLRKTKLDPVRR